jgi:lysophospholipase L1-like esterase
MADLAHANNIAVIFSSVLPVNNYTPSSQRFFAGRSMDKIRELNTWLKERTRTHGEIYLDYYSYMLDRRGLLKREMAEDGLHPNDRGYRIMADLAAKAISQALAKNSK